MLFARAVGDPNPVYYDAEAAKDSEVGGIIAPPTFVQAGSQYDPDFPLRPRIGEPWFGSGREATGTQVSQTQGGGTALHGEQHYTYHRPLRPGDVLTVTHEPGMTWEKTNRSGATVKGRAGVVARPRACLEGQGRSHGRWAGANSKVSADPWPRRVGSC